MYQLDRLDAQILLARDKSRDTTALSIGHDLGISRNTVRARLQRLAGASRPASGAVPPAAVGRPLLAFVTLLVSQREIEFIYASLRSIPEVIEVHTVSGNVDLMMRVVARDTVDLHRITQLIQSTAGVHRSSTSIATTEVIPHRMDPLLAELATS